MEIVSAPSQVSGQAVVKLEAAGLGEGSATQPVRVVSLKGE